MPSPNLLRRLRLVAVALVGLLVLALLAVTGWVTQTVRESFPQTTGEVTVPGVSTPVEVVRDSYGIPQVYADNAADLFRAQGYVTAQDRFWEMDLRRHATAGRLAELFGPKLVSTDVTVRTLGWRRTAEQELALFAPATRRYLDAYAEGVNAYLRGRMGAELSVQHGLLDLTNGYRPQPWTPADSVAWLKAMAWDLRGNSSDELDRALLATRLPVERVEQLYPAYPYDRHPVIVRAGAVVNGRFDHHVTAPPRLLGKARSALAGTAGLLDRMPALLGPNGRGVGSNSWVVSGARSATGKPLLANDPHLAPALPAVWYQMGLHCRVVTAACPFDVVGGTFAGTPGVIIGHNAQVAWGFTNLPADVADFYLERVEGDRYRYEGKLWPLDLRQEVIEVAGGKPVTVTVRATRHGPLLSDAQDRLRVAGAGSPRWLNITTHSRAAAAAGQGGDYAVAFRWTATNPGHTMDAVFLLDQARDWPEFRAAARKFAVPAQNLLYADTAGNIGYQMPGEIPIRRGGDGRWPVPGWTRDYEWTGTIPFEALPHAYNPPAGYLVTANNPVVGPTYPYHLTSDWDYGYRAKRIDALLVQAGKLDVPTMQRIQNDTVNPAAELLVPLLSRFKTDPFTRDAQRLLIGWDFTQPADSAAAAYFNAVWRQILARTFNDELPPGTRPDGYGRWVEVMRRLLEEPTNPWWDDARTRHRETREEVLQSALREARLELTARLGKQVSGWRWGRLHQLELRSSGFGAPQAPAPLRWLLNPDPVELGGGAAAVNAVGWNADEGYRVSLIPSLRMVVDLRNLDESRWVLSTGASGHAHHRNEFDQTAPWRDGETIPLPFSRAAVRAASRDRLILRPGPVPSG